MKKTPLINSFERNISKKTVTKLSLVALMDIFTVLIFFLMFNIHEKQSIRNQRIDDLPISKVAYDLLKKENVIISLEIVNYKNIYLNQKEIYLDDSFNKLEMDLSLIPNLKSSFLTIQAPKNMDYSFVHKFVELGNKVGFKGVYLIVIQEK
ncbi:hypothetical protein GNP73_08395 [Aliivibrio fischeri]|uniref:biopolymer transporter ExbD n=1 Tax=Aliivibrio fischeri TaxID=668 RepID=UPI0012DA09E5|nr:biopolymer transporter ExbD [Aliivibrio fischeri]MUJ27993.1 hypothetical protein [Aliivibrio fischeri]